MLLLFVKIRQGWSDALRASHYAPRIKRIFFFPTITPKCYDFGQKASGKVKRPPGSVEKVRPNGAKSSKMAGADVFPAQDSGYEDAIAFRLSMCAPGAARSMERRREPEQIIHDMKAEGKKEGPPATEME